MARPATDEYASHFGTYISLVPENDILVTMRSELAQTLAVLSGIAEQDASVCHPPYTWTIKQVVGHLTDYRANLRLPRTAVRSRRCNPPARLRREPLRPTRRSPTNGRSPALAAEFEAVRKSHLCLFESLPDDAWNRRGIASNNEISVRALAYAIVGHERHHMSIIRKRLATPTSPIKRTSSHMNRCRERILFLIQKHQIPILIRARSGGPGCLACLDFLDHDESFPSRDEIQADFDRICHRLDCPR